MSNSNETLDESKGLGFYDYKVKLGREALNGMGAHRALEYWRVKGLAPDYSALGHSVVVGAWAAEPVLVLTEVLATVTQLFTDAGRLGLEARHDAA